MCRRTKEYFMKVFIDRIQVREYNLAMDIIKGLESGSSETKYECVLDPSFKNQQDGHFDVAIYAVEPSDKKLIGFECKKE